MVPGPYNSVTTTIGNNEESLFASCNKFLLLQQAKYELVSILKLRLSFIYFYSLLQITV